MFSNVLYFIFFVKKCVFYIFCIVLWQLWEEYESRKDMTNTHALCLLSSSTFSRLVCSLFLSCSSSRTRFCNFMKTLRSMAAFSTPISCRKTHQMNAHPEVSLNSFQSLLADSLKSLYLHLLDGVISVSHLWHTDGGVVGVRAQTALVRGVPPVTGMELEP